MSKISDYGGDFIPCGNVVTSKNGKNFVGKFRGKPLWIIFENTDYHEEINANFPNDTIKVKIKFQNIEFIKTENLLVICFQEKMLTIMIFCFVY